MYVDAQEWTTERAHRADRSGATAALAADVLRHRLARTGSARLRVRGGSMRPLLADGAWVELRPVAGAEKLAGRIVAVDAGELVVVHRVTRARDGWIETRGIARETADPVQPRSAVIGVARAIAGLSGGERWLRPLAASCATVMRARALVARGLR